jgi:RNA polymerase sigma-70 factor (ECF subfamily)
MGGSGHTYTDDDSLVAALRQGDESAFEWLLGTYDSTLRRVARNYVPTDTLADDVVQDTWMGLIRGIDDFEQRSSLKTWLYRILLNIARTKGVREKRSIPFSSAADALADSAEPAFDPERFRAPTATEQYPGGWVSFPMAWETQPERVVESSETVGIVNAAVEQLPPAQREVLTLRDIEGWTSAEVCNALELTETNQRVLLHRARARVRRALELYFEGVMAT